MVTEVPGIEDPLALGLDLKGKGAETAVVHQVGRDRERADAEPGRPRKAHRVPAGALIFRELAGDFDQFQRTRAQVHGNVRMNLAQETVVVLMGMGNQHGIYRRRFPIIESLHGRQDLQIFQLRTGQTVIVPHTELRAVRIHQRHANVQNDARIARRQFDARAANFTAAAMDGDSHQCCFPPVNILSIILESAVSPTL